MIFRTKLKKRKSLYTNKQLLRIYFSDKSNMLSYFHDCVREKVTDI